MFPKDGHAPQHKVNSVEVIKKLQLKYQFSENIKSYSFSSHERKQ